MFSSLLNLRVNLSFSFFIWLPEYLYSLLASPLIPLMFFLNLFSRSFIWESQISIIGPLLSSIYIHSFGDFIQLDHFLKCHILDNSHVFRAQTPPWTSASHSDAQSTLPLWCPVDISNSTCLKRTLTLTLYPLSVAPTLFHLSSKQLEYILSVA